MSLEEFGKGHGGAGGTPVAGSGEVPATPSPGRFAFSQDSEAPRQETDEEIVARLSKFADTSKPTVVLPTGEKAVFIGSKSKKADNPLTPFKGPDGTYYDKRNGKPLPKEKWKAPWDGLNGAQASAPSPGVLSKKSADQVEAIRAVKSKATKGGFTPSTNLLQLGGAITNTLNKLHSFATSLPTTFHNYYGSQTADHVKSALASITKAQGHLADAQANHAHSPGMAGNALFDAAMATHKALGHLTQPAIYRRFNGRLPEGVTHDTTEGLVTAAAEHSYGVSGAKPANLFSLAGKEYDLDKEEHLNALVKKIPSMTPEQKDIIVSKIKGYQPSTTKPHALDPEFEKKTAARAEEQESITQGIDTVANPRGEGTVKVETGRGNKARKGNIGEVIDTRQASRMADGTMPAGGTSIGRGDSSVGVVDTGTAAREASRAAAEEARRAELSKVAAAEKEEAARKKAIEDAKPKPEKGPRTKRKPAAASIPTKSMSFDQIINGVKKRGNK